MFTPQDTPTSTPHVQRLPAARRQATMAELVAQGLERSAKSLPPMLFYDARGSELFEQICRLEAYYVTRTERALLAEHADALTRRLEPAVTVAELGSGSSEKTDLVLEALLGTREHLRYVPVDISAAALEAAAERLVARFPRLEVRGLCAEYQDGVQHLARLDADQHLVLFLGSNIGNFEADEAAAFLNRLARAMRPQDRLLLGVDMVKDRAILERAYDDPEGVTAAFNLNMLAHLNHALGANFDLAAFRHEAFFNARASRVEMHLVSTKAQDVHVAALGRSFHFEEGESIHTENSHKYTPEALEGLIAAGGWRTLERVTDEAGAFSLCLLAPRPEVLA